MEDANWADSKSITAFSGAWSVPGSPSTNDGQTIFLFIGLEPTSGNSIIQPEIQWGPAADGGGSYWVITSWYADALGNVYYSTPAQVSPSDSVQGTMQFYPNICHWGLDEYDVTSGADSGINIGCTLMNYGYGQNLAFVTLEAYGVKTCSEYHSSGSTNFNNLILYDTGGSVTPTWAKWYNSAATNCNNDVSIISSNSVTLYY